MDTFERRATRSLAIAYNAYLEASYESKAGLQFWASMLLHAQRETGVELIPIDRLLYPLTGDATLTNVTVQTLRATVTPEVAALSYPGDEPSRGVLRSQSGMIEGPDPDCDGPSKLGVLAPQPQPRKPSPGAAVSPASRAAAFYANR